MSAPAIKFDLLANARDSLRRAVDLLAWDDFNSRPAQLKHAITNASHAIELLLKERLRKEHPAFVWQNVDKYPNLEAFTVSAETAVIRLRAVCDLKLSKADSHALVALRSTRNAIEHYEWHTTEGEARIIVGNALSFAFSFATDHLNIDLSQDFKKDDTWRLLVEQADEFRKAHGERVKLAGPEVHLVSCDQCGEETVTALGSCLLCGHWQTLDI
jgi:hypothetical protein